MVYVYNLDAEKVGEIDLPIHFYEEIRPDLIKRAVLAIYSHKRQPYGAYRYAGLEASAWTSKRRRDHRSSYGKGISRVPRSALIARGEQFIWVAREVPNAVKGRRAHPPKPEKVWYEKINKKERKKAIRSAIAATGNVNIVLNRYEKARPYLKEVIDKFGLPLVISEDLENISKTKEAKQMISNFLSDNLIEIFSHKKIRAGKGKRRGRRYDKHRGALLVVSSEEVPIIKAAKSLEFVEVVPVHRLNAEVLAPGAHPGRFTLWSAKAIEKLKEGLFM